MIRPAQRCPCTFAVPATAAPNIASSWSCRVIWAALALCGSSSATLRASPSEISISSMVRMSCGVFLQVGHSSVATGWLSTLQVSSMQHLWNLWRHGKMVRGTALRPLSARLSSGSSLRLTWQIAQLSSHSAAPDCWAPSSPPPWGSPASGSTPVGGPGALDNASFGAASAAASASAAAAAWLPSASASASAAMSPGSAATPPSSNAASSVASRSTGSSSFHDIPRRRLRQCTLQSRWR